MATIAPELAQHDPPEGTDALAGMLAARREAQVFHHARWQMARTLVRQTFEQARLRAAVVAVVSIIFWVGLFGLFAEGFVFLRDSLQNEALRAQTVQAIYNVFFLALTVMLTLSSAIISYSNMYRGEEIAFLLTLPARPGRLVLHKFQEAVLFSCWGFLLLGSPLLIAYGVTSHSPWYYYATLLPFMLSFVLIPTSLGTLICMLVVYYLPTLRMYALWMAAAVTVVAAIAWGWMAIGSPSQNLLTPDWFQQMLGRLQFAEQRLLPSWWLSSGLLEAAHPSERLDGSQSWQESLWFLATLLANALVAMLLVVEVGSRYFRAGYSGLQGLAPARRLMRESLIDRALRALTAFLPRQTSILLVKDFQVFRRDPVQWSQFAIFFGLLSLYFFNIRRFNYGESLRQWMTVVGFMNLAVVGLILSTFTTRFIFPLVSLEGRRFWILGTAPLERRVILRAKFLFAALGSIVPCSLLILLSDIMLRIAQRTPLVAVIHQYTCLVLCLGLSAMAVGLGARLPNLREPSPSKIAAGFGGTLNLILNMAFIVAVVFASAFPCYYWVEGVPAAWRGGDTQSAWWAWIGLGTTGSVVVGLTVVAILGLIGTVVPLFIGMRAFEKLEP